MWACTLILSRCWPSKYGLVLERDTSARPAPKSHSGSNLNPVDPSARPLPVWFGLLHPLDDYSRILTRSKSGSTLREMMTDTHKIVHVAKDPSMYGERGLIFSVAMRIEEELL